MADALSFAPDRLDEAAARGSRDTRGYTPPPRRAFTALARPHRYRVVRDAEGCPIIPGRYGRLEWHDETLLAVYSDRPRLFGRLWATPGVRRWQVGDQEVARAG